MFFRIASEKENQWIQSMIYRSFTHKITAHRQYNKTSELSWFDVDGERRESVTINLSYLAVSILLLEMQHTTFMKFYIILRPINFDQQSFSVMGLKDPMGHKAGLQQHLILWSMLCIFHGHRTQF